VSALSFYGARAVDLAAGALHTVDYVGGTIHRIDYAPE
jgi:hypothetical protein